MRGAVAERILVLPHLDLLTTSVGGLTSEAREAIPLLYENPELVFLGFKDPSFPVPRVIENSSLAASRFSALRVNGSASSSPSARRGSSRREQSSSRTRSTSTCPE